MEQKDNYMLPYEYDRYMQTDKWRNEIPFIKFPSDWEIQITPPFAGATVRFRVKKSEAHVSVYLDCYDKLGCCGQPYWEIYPHENDTFRCWLNETEALLKAIQESLDSQTVS